MTKKELYEYIDRFAKNPGCYTEDELFDIGVAHRNCSQREKNWNELANYVGFERGGESYRYFVYNRLKKNKNYKPQFTMKELDSEFESQKRQLYIEKTKVRDILNDYRALLREQARKETLEEFITNAINKTEKYPKIDFVPSDNYKENSRIEAILMLSDWHIGVECHNYYNTYNIEIAKKRLSKLCDKVIKYCRLHNVERLDIVNLGDLIHGLIHVTARIEQECNTVDQTIIASDLLAQVLCKLQNAAPEVIYRSVTDNHARTVADKSESIEADSYSRIIDWYIKAKLENTNIIFKSDNMDYDLGKFTLINGKKVVFAHGHNDTINRSFENFIGATQEFIHYGLLAHYHSEKMKSFQGFKVFVNGSVVGSEQYATSKRLFSKPSQTLLIFDDTDIINHSIELDINE